MPFGTLRIAKTCASCEKPTAQTGTFAYPNTRADASQAKEPVSSPA